MSESPQQEDPVLISLRVQGAQIPWPSVNHVWRDTDISVDLLAWRQRGLIPAPAFLLKKEQLGILGELNRASFNNIQWLDDNMEPLMKDIQLPQGAVGWFGPSPIYVLK